MGVDEFWAKSLGCSVSDLNFETSKLAVKNQKTDYNRGHSDNDVDVFCRAEEKIVSCSEKAYNRFEAIDLSKLEPAKTSLKRKGLEVEKVLGPAFLSHVTKQTFNSANTQNVRILKEDDREAFTRLKESSDEKEIEDSIADFVIKENNIFGKFEDGKIVAAASYEVWDDQMAFIGVFVKKEFRGRGFGKEVVSRAAEDCLEKGLIPVYRTLEKWSSSVGIAKSLGFRKYATTYLVVLVEL